ncbi:MAG: AmmeMemoRadiSam system protein B [Candidatus Aenigmatarchaeota archaeon]
MLIRNPAVAGSFYPLSSNELASMIKRFMNESKARPRQCMGVVAPHAGYVYCGKVFASVYSALSGSDFDTVVILGPNHMGAGAGIATGKGMWKTPLGSVSVDEEFAGELPNNNIFNDPGAHRNEHSIEVQLPWLQAVFANKRSRFQRFVPVAINLLYYTKEHCKALGNRIADVAEKLNRKTLVIASSDFTHHGRLYGYTPFSGSGKQILKRIKETDMEIAGYASKLMPERLVEVCRERNLSICGFGAIAAMLWAAKRLGAKNGEILDYSTSYDVSRDTNAIVAYCGIAVF